jgi:hypothetical protein
MIKLRLEIRNPWSKDRFKNLGCVFGKITKHTAWELEHTFYDGMLVDLDFEFTTKQDHAGIRFSLGVFGYAVGFSIYDTRHWDQENNCWKKYDEKNIL